MNDGLHDVHILALPLDLQQRAEEHSNELIREFSLIRLREQDQHSHTVPVRLLELIDRLTRQFAGSTGPVDLEREAAREAGQESVDLTYHLPAAAADASRELGSMLDEADEFCRAGAALLTLAAPPEVKQFRSWYLEEFVRQLAGAEPIPWPDYAQAAKAQP